MSRLFLTPKRGLCWYRSEWDQTALKRAPVNRRKTRSKITYFSRFRDNKKPGLIKNKTTGKKGQCTTRSTRTSLNWKTKVAVISHSFYLIWGYRTIGNKVSVYTVVCAGLIGSYKSAIVIIRDYYNLRPKPIFTKTLLQISEQFYTNFLSTV